MQKRTPKTVQVAIFGAPLKTATIESGATVGAVFGVNLFNKDGTLVTAAQFGGGQPSEPPSAVCVWSRTLLEIPRNVQEVENLATAGIVVRQASSDWITRQVVPTIGRTTVANGDGAGGDIVIDLAVVIDSGAGALLAVTRDSYGRITGTRDATITGTDGRITVANGDASAGLPTIDLAEVADTGGGALKKLARDGYGRVTGTSNPTTDDLPEGVGPTSPIYFTNARAVDALETWDGGPDYLQLLLDEYNP